MQHGHCSRTAATARAQGLLNYTTNPRYVPLNYTTETTNHETRYIEFMNYACFFVGRLTTMTSSSLSSWSSFERDRTSTSSSSVLAPADAPPRKRPRIFRRALRGSDPFLPTMTTSASPSPSLSCSIE